MVTTRLPQKRRRRRSGFRFLFIFTATTVMVATGGFGAFPDNPLTQMFREVIGENIPADFLNPFNAYMENLSAPQIPPQPASASENGSPPDPLGFLNELFAGNETASEPPLPSEQDIVETAMASIQETQTQLVILTPATLSPTSTQVQTSTPTFTLAPTSTETLVPTLTVPPPVIIYPASTKKPPPANTITPSPTDTLAPFLGFTVSTVDVNGAGSYAIVSPGASVNVSYSFEVYDDPCPGCVTQLVTGLGTPGSNASTCAFDGDAALFPGTSGFEDVILTAPINPGIYSVVVEYYWELGCANALALYGTGTGQQAPSQTIAQIEVQQPLVLYEGGIIDGNIGPRASADAICAANLPPGYGNYHAFIAYSASDSIANMPANYGIPTNIPIYSASNILIANDWADLMDGTIATSLNTANVTSGISWWSGVENASGIQIDGVTDDCNDWTSNSSFVGGWKGNSATVDSSWMFYFDNACFQAWSVLCVGY